MTASSETGGARCLYLPICGPVRLSGPDGRVHLRRKALAVLYFLAFEGPTLRDRLADLLWDGPDPLANLRVEINAINRELAAAGVPQFARYQDPLELPPGLRLDLQGNSAVSLLEGLDDLGGADFQEWLGWRRARLRAAGTVTFGNSPLIERLAATLRAPHLLVVEPEPFESASGFVEALSQRMRSPVLPLGATGAGLRYAAPPYPAELVGRIIRDERSIWVFERPYLGNDPDELLELRYRLPAASISYQKLPAGTWLAARSGTRLRDMEFDAAARLFLACAGHLGYLAEISALSDEQNLPVPQKYRAALELELRKLRPACRQLVESLVSIRPQLAGKYLSESASADDCLGELVDRRWLEFGNEGWCFTSPFIRRLLNNCLPEGVARSHHRRRSREMEANGEALASLLHLHMAGEPVDTDRLLDSLAGWARVAVEEQAGNGSRLGPGPTRVVRPAAQDSFVEVAGPFGSGAESSGTSFALVRLGQEQEPCGVRLLLPEGVHILHLSGEARVQNVLGVGFTGDAVPLSLRLDGGRRVVMAPALPCAVLGQEMLLPLNSRFDYWFSCPRATELSIESNSECSVIQFEARLYEESTEGRECEAFALTA
mgnify:CR=1 FL=1